jgi:hypothetical protein
MEEEGSLTDVLNLSPKRGRRRGGGDMHISGKHRLVPLWKTETGKTIVMETEEANP